MFFIIKLYSYGRNTIISTYGVFVVTLLQLPSGFTHVH